LPEKDKKVFVVQSDVLTVESLACDWLTNKLYWIDLESNRLEVSDLNGGNRSILLSKGLEFVSSLALAPLDGLMFLSHWGEAKRIESISMDGDTTTRRQLVDNIVAYSIAIDHRTRKLYWTEAYTKSIFSIGFNGDNKRIVVDKPAEINPLAITLSDNKLYWSDMNSFQLLVRNKLHDTQRKVLLNEKRGTPIKQLQLYQAATQPQADHPCAVANGNCSNLCLLSSQRPLYTCHCPSGHKMLADGKTCSSTIETFLLVAHREDIKMVSLETSQFAISKIKVKNSKNVNAIDFDPIEKRLYWTDEFLKTINSATLNGTDKQIIVEDSLASFQNVALDFLNRNMYWTDSGQKRIVVSKMNGQYRSVLVSNHIENPRGLAVHPVEGHFYWTDWGKQPKIEKVSLDGMRRIVLINENLVWPNDLTIDYHAARIYWCDARLHKIEHATLDGVDRRELIASPILLQHPFSLTIIDQYVYWTDWIAKGISRADKNHAGPELIASSPKVMGLKGVSLANQFFGNFLKKKEILETILSVF
jgi:low density lipoprotein receptor-related protein 5/6